MRPKIRVNPGFPVRVGRYERWASSMESITQCVNVSLNFLSPSLRSDAPHPQITKTAPFWGVLAPKQVKNENFHFPKRRASSLVSITQCVNVSLNSLRPSLRSDAPHPKITKNEPFLGFYIYIYLQFHENGTFSDEILELFLMNFIVANMFRNI